MIANENNDTGLAVMRGSVITLSLTFCLKDRRERETERERERQRDRESKGNNFKSVFSLTFVHVGQNESYALIIIFFNFLV